MTSRDDIRRNRQAFSTRHRIVDARGAIHEVIVIGDELSDDEGTVVGTQGFYVDLTSDDAQRQESITAAVAEIAERAFELLPSRSTYDQLLLTAHHRIDDTG
jgi:hypothetical protein